MQTETKAAAPKRERPTLSSANTTTTGSGTVKPKTAEKPDDADKLPAGNPARGSVTELTAPASIEPQPPKEAVPPTAAAHSDAPNAEQPKAPVAPPEWSSEDESAFQAMLARRKAAGHRGRGKDVGSQSLRVGDIAPNPGTVVATIVALVAECGTITRANLLDAMAIATFPNSKAKPTDRGWCQGYVAGAVRDGFLAVAANAPAETVAR